jgi:FtsZ-binding cell division protein ZapB
MTMGKDDQGQRGQSAARSYRAALARLVRGEGRHADHAGRVVKITPTSVAREAGRSRNPLYTSHRDILDEIEAAAGPGTPARDLAARIATLETELTHLRADARRHAEERRELASENLTLLHRARSAEDRLTALLRRMPETPTAGAIMQPR